MNNKAFKYKTPDHPFGKPTLYQAAMRNFTLRLPAELDAGLERLSLATGKSKAVLIREAVEGLLKPNGIPASPDA